jgi:putative membrane protein
MTLPAKSQNKQVRNDLLCRFGWKIDLETLLEFAFPATVTLLLALVMFWYVRGWLRLRVTFPHLVSFARVAVFSTGVLLVWLALASPFARLDHHLLSVHMIQHLVVMAIAAPLLLLGAPGPVLLRTLPQSLFRRAASDTLRKIAPPPVFCWLAGTAAVIVWHIPAVFQLGLHSPGWHQTQHATFFVAGLLFWWPVIQPWPSASREPRWSIPLYLFLATLPCDALSAYLVFCDHVVYRHYLVGRRLLGVSALQDQQWAGALMWVSVTFTYLIPAVAVTFELLSTASRKPQKVVVSPNPPDRRQTPPGPPLEREK